MNVHRNKNALTVGQSALLSVGADSDVLTLNRNMVEVLIEALIEVLNIADANPDLEDNGDREWIDEREPEDGE